MIKKIFILIFILSSSIFAQENAGTFLKEKREIMRLKKDLNNFYNKKEEEYQNRKKELEKLLSKVQSERKQIERVYEKNQDILADIKGEVASKTTKIYNSMKPKVAGAIFDNMILDGKIDDVFDIMLKLKEKKVTQIMRSLSVNNAAQITQKFKDYSSNVNTQE